MIGRTLRTIAATTLLTTAAGSAGCGYLLHPERRGTQSGTIDSGTMVMDLLWLLPGILPGVVALIVDFSSGAIYVRGRAAVVPLSPDRRLVVRLPRTSKPTRFEVRLVTSARRAVAREMVSIGPTMTKDQSVELRLGPGETHEPVFLEVQRDDGVSARLSMPL